jgi:hypothetical protein
MIHEFSFGGVPSPTDYRDIGLAQALGEPKNLPLSYFVDTHELPVWHQRKLGSCVGHAFGKYKQKVDQEDTQQIKSLSPRYLYAMAKAQDIVQGEGTYPRLVAKILKDYGCATEEFVPNDSKLTHEEYVFNRDIRNIPQTGAEQAKIKSYAFVDITEEGLKQAIIEGKGCALLVQVGKEWYTDKRGNSTWDKKKILPLRAPKEVISGHEIYLTGYEGDRFYFMNSWSEDWGDNGVGYFDWYEYKNHIIEGITIVDIPDHLIEEVKKLPASFNHQFKLNLEYGDTHDEVKWLQRALKILGVYNYSVTGYYGDITAKAVLDFQKRYKVTTIWENITYKGRYFGPKTRAEINKLIN